MQNTCQLAVCDDDTGPWAIHSEGENAPKMQSQTTVRQCTPSGRLIDSEARTIRLVRRHGSATRTVGDSRNRRRTALLAYQ